MSDRMDESNKYFDEGVELYEEGKFKEAIVCFDKAIEINPNFEDTWNGKGAALYALNKYEEAIVCFDKAIEINPKYEKAWYNKGNALYDFNKKEEAIVCYDKAIEINPNDEDAWCNKGNVLSALNKKEEAIVCYNKAIEINPKHEYVWYNKGAALSDLNKYEEAIVCYDKTIEINPNDEDAWHNKGHALYYFNKYEEAIVCYDKAIAVNPKYEYAWNNKGAALKFLKKYEEAAICFKKAIKINPKDILYRNNHIDSLIALKKYKAAARSYKEGKLGDVLGFMVRLKDESEENIRKAILYILEEEDFFNQIVPKGTAKRDKYKNLYYTSLYIISLLHVTRESEKPVAHYTSKKDLECFLFPKEDKDSKEDPKPLKYSTFRFFSVTTSNDPKEGLTLLDSLWQNKQEKDCFSRFIQDEKYRAFAGCFTFNDERLNQFRLYGKDSGKEATGVSMALSQDFFSSNIKQSTPLSFSEDKKEKKEEEEKHPLFRCIYIDPNTGHIASIGQKEEYSFYRNNEEDDLEGYKTYIEDILGKVRKNIEKLKEDIQKLKEDIEKDKEDIEKDKLEKEIVGKLLINLRYLTKHVAFKEEQECRVIRIEPIDKGDIHIEGDRLYIDYLPIYKYVEKICFAPKAEGMELFIDKLRHSKYTIECRRCDHPFSG